jgi:protein-L-isoaspartate(D-aspartate) O-methyltransferase
MLPRKLLRFIRLSFRGAFKSTIRERLLACSLHLAAERMVRNLRNPMIRHSAIEPRLPATGPAPPGPSGVEDRADLPRDRRRAAGAGRRRALAGLAAALLAASACGAATGPSLDARRQAMVDEIARRGVERRSVLEALRKVPRHEFVPVGQKHLAYADQPLLLEHGQTISQPYVVGLMTELLELGPGSKVLEIGTGSGYHAAVLAELAREVFTIEIVRPLADRARATLARLGYDNVHVRAGDGFRGWPEEAPFDAILLTAAPPEVPAPLLEQLKVGGRMVLPQGRGEIQDLLVVTKTAESLERQRVAAVRFVPMTGEAQKEP